MRIGKYRITVTETFEDVVTGILTFVAMIVLMGIVCFVL